MLLPPCVPNCHFALSFLVQEARVSSIIKMMLLMIMIIGAPGQGASANLHMLAESRQMGKLTKS